MQNATVRHPTTAAPPAQILTNTIVGRIVPVGPDIRSMTDLLWRGVPDGFVPFSVRSTTGGWRDIASVPVSWLQSSKQPWLPYLLDKLKRDGYAGVNPMFRAGAVERRREVYEPAVVEGQHVEQLVTRISQSRRKPGTGGLFYPHRAADDAAWLTACYVDCDGSKAAAQTDGPGTVANVLRAYRSGRVPVPSFVVSSGAGAWPFWQLVDERNPAEGSAWVGTPGHKRWHQPDTACKSSRYSVTLHHAVNAALAERLRDIGADSCVDAAVSVRVFGSVNSKVGAQVEVLPILIDGFMRAYTLGELASWLKVPLRPGRPPKAIGHRTVQTPASEAQVRQRIDAVRARHGKVVNAIVQLGALRGGFRHRSRNMAIFYLALSAYLSGRSDAAVLDVVQAEAHRCEGYGQTSDFGARQVNAIMRNARRKASLLNVPTDKGKRKPPKYATVIAALGITVAEQSRIGLEPRAVSRKRIARVQTFDGLIHAIRARLGYWGTDAPSSRTMAAELTAAGFAIGHNAVALAYRRLGLASGQRGGRVSQVPLPLG